MNYSLYSSQGVRYQKYRKFCHFILITGNILRSVNDIPIVNREYRYTKIVIPGFCPIHFTITFGGQTNVGRYTGNIVIRKIVKPGFHCIKNVASQYENNL